MNNNFDLKNNKKKKSIANPQKITANVKSCQKTARKEKQTQKHI